ncbi:MAG: hypothetical protein ACQEVA_18960 [Myxococcota bacterium]
MKERNIIALIAAVMLTVGFAPDAFAQEGGAEQEEEAAADTVDSSETTEEEAERGPKTPEEDGEGDEAAAEDASEDASADQGDAAEEGEASEPKTGPGGRPLREDYPGTEESKQERMDTDKIEGLEFEEGQTPEDVYDMRIRELETRVDDLKEKVFQSKSRIVLLKETVLSGNISGSRAVVTHNTDLGGAYEVVRVLYSLDGARVYNESDEGGSLSDKDNFEVYNGSISPGNHKLSILLELKGSGFGVFSYMEGYKFRIKDSCSFKAQSGKNTIVDVKLYDRGRGKYEYEERPSIRCSVSSVDYASEEIANATTDTESGQDAAPSDDAEETDGN